MYKKIDVIIIGLNAEKTLKNCIESIYKTSYEIKDINIVYVDGGSTDESVNIAKEMNVETLELNLEYPTPGKQRNEGWKAGKSEFVQFLDSDTELDKNWLIHAIKIMEDEEVGAVFGDRIEKYPEKSIFNFIGNLEWNTKSGEADFFGGDVLVKRKVLEKTGGYRDNLIAGEDPECAHRIRKMGYKLIKLDCLMTKHDLAMYKIKQYWKRAYRTGYAYAEVNSIHNEVWKRDLKRILIRGGGAITLILSGILLGAINHRILAGIVSMLVGFLLLIRPRLTLKKYFMKEMKILECEAIIYSWHASFVVIPQFFGFLRYYFGKKIKKPLRNKANKLRILTSNN